MAEVTIYNSVDAMSYKDALIQIPLGVYEELCVKVAILEFKRDCELEELKQKLEYAEHEQMDALSAKWKIASELEEVKKELASLKADKATEEDAF